MSSESEKQYYRSYKAPRKAEKIFKAMCEIIAIKASTRPQKKLNRGVVVLGAKQPT